MFAISTIKSKSQNLSSRCVFAYVLHCTLILSHSKRFSLLSSTQCMRNFLKTIQACFSGLFGLSHARLSHNSTNILPTSMKTYILNSEKANRTSHLTFSDFWTIWINSPIFHNGLNVMVVDTSEILVLVERIFRQQLRSHRQYNNRELFSRYEITPRLPPRGFLLIRFILIYQQVL